MMLQNTTGSDSAVIKDVFNNLITLEKWDFDQLVKSGIL